MNSPNNSIRFPLPSEVETVAGAEDADSMYPTFRRVVPEDDKRFWFYDAMHYPEVIPPFDCIVSHGVFSALSAFANRVFVFPNMKGLDVRIINGRVYLSAVMIDDPKEIEERLAIFQTRAQFYYENWDDLYEKWKSKMTALIHEIDELPIPDLPEVEDESVVMTGKGISQSLLLNQTFNQSVDKFTQMWHYHMEMILLGYGAYLTFFQFCRQAFPEISDQTIASMTRGVDALIFKPDLELRKLAKLSVELGLEDVFLKEAAPEVVMQRLHDAGEPGKKWIAAMDAVREPWFHLNTGEGTYHHHRSWNEDLSVPFSGMANYIKQLQAGESIDRNIDEIHAERAMIIKEHRELLPTEADKAAYDQLVALVHRVFPFVEDHKFYCEHWLTSRFFGKVRRFGDILTRFGIIEESEDIFMLNHFEVAEALSDVSAAWPIGLPPIGCAHWQSVVLKRKAMFEKLKGWSAPPALGPVPENIEDPLLLMLYGITPESLQVWGMPDEQSDTVLRGFAASAGLVEGIARVITDANDIGQVRDGEVLVCPVTSPSWASVFGKLKAAVTDIGGTMSHAAIVAREFSLPSVVGTGYATTKIKTGQRIRVDGHNGVVTILEDA